MNLNVAQVQYVYIKRCGHNSSSVHHMCLSSDGGHSGPKTVSVSVKLFLSLFIHDLYDQKCLPEGSRSNRWCPGLDGSFKVLAALMRQQELKIFDKCWIKS